MCSLILGKWWVLQGMRLLFGLTQEFHTFSQDWYVFILNWWWVWSWFSKQHDSWVLTEWLVTLGMVKEWECRVLTIISISWLWAIWTWVMASIIFSKSIGSSFCCDWAWKDGYEGWVWKFWWSRESIKFWGCCSDSRKISILVSKTSDWSFWKGGTKYDSWKYYGIREANISWNFCLASCMASILFSNSDFFSKGGSKKRV